MSRQNPIPDAALDDRLAFVGTAGAGKTYCAMGRVERLLAKKARVVIPDPLGVWWGLRLSADGKAQSPYGPAIFGGPHGDLPLTEHAGALIGETVAVMAESCILDLSQLGTKAAERRFMLAFLTALYKHTTGEPLHVIFDEADMWSPQRLLDKEGDSAKLLGMMETIVRRGRSKGFIPWLISQRPAVISKDVLSQVDGLVAFKLTSSQDRDAIGDWVEGQADKQMWREIWASLPTMERGQGVVWIPGRAILETVQFPEKDTFDSSRTPKRGERAKRAAELKPLDLGRLKERLAQVEAETKANDPKVLRAEIVRLQKELKAKEPAKNIPKNIPISQPDAKALAAAVKYGDAAGYQRAASETNDRIKAIFQSMRDVITAFFDAERGIVDAQKAIVNIVEWSGRAAKTVPKSLAIPRVHLSREQVASNGHAPLPRSVPAAAPVSNEGVSGPQQRLIDAVAWWGSFGHERPTRAQVAFVASYKPNTGTFNTYLGALSSAGLIAYPDRGRVILTEAGVALANSPGARPSHDELIERVNGVLSGPQRKLLSSLIDRYPDPMTRDELAEASGYQSNTGSFNTYLGSLSSLKIVEYPQRGKVLAAEWLFP